MRNTLILLVVLLGLLGGYFFFLYEQGGSSLDKSEIDFAIPDTAKITEVVMVKVVGGQDGEGIHLEKAGDGWQVNGQYGAFRPHVEKFLHVLSQIRVRDVLPPKGQATAQDLLARGHTRVELFSEKGLVKSYLVGTEYKGGKGTLMKLEKADDAYIVELPGLQGYLNVYYSLDTGFWRENLLFRGALSYIRSVSVSYSKKTGSFELFRENEQGKWYLQGVEQGINEQALDAYLAHFTGKVYGETFAGERFPDKLETLRAETPDVILSVEFFSGETEKVVLFERSDNPNSYFGWVEGKEELLTIQHFVIDKYLAQKSDFLLPAL